MKPIYKTLTALAFLLAVPVSFSSCQEDSPEVDYTMRVAVENDLTDLVNAINQGNLKGQKAINKITEALDNMTKSHAEILEDIASIITSTKNTLDTKLAAIAATMNTNKLPLEKKLEALVKAIGDHSLKQVDLTDMITQAIDKVSESIKDPLTEIKRVINDEDTTPEERATLIKGAMASDKLSLEDKLQIIEEGLGIPHEDPEKRIETAAAAAEALNDEVKDDDTLEMPVKEAIDMLAKNAAEAHQGLPTSNDSPGEILRQLQAYVHDVLLALQNNSGDEDNTDPIPS